MKVILDYPDFSLEKDKLQIEILKEWFEELIGKKETPLRYCTGIELVEYVIENKTLSLNSDGVVIVDDNRD